MRVTLISLLVVLPLAACNIRQADEQTHAAQFAADEATCTGYGFKKDTPEFANCLLELDQTHKGYATAPQPQPLNEPLHRQQSIRVKPLSKAQRRARPHARRLLAA